jgi:hypothetical protein
MQLIYLSNQFLYLYISLIKIMNDIIFLLLFIKINKEFNILIKSSINLN